MSVIVWVVGVVVVVVGEVVVDVDVLLEVHPLRVVARMVRAINSEATVRRYFFMQTPFIFRNIFTAKMRLIARKTTAKNKKETVYSPSGGAKTNVNMRQQTLSFPNGRLQCFH
jgi:hypothetical protein